MLIKTVRQNEIIPRFYGVAWIDYYRDQAVCLPLGVNLLAALVRILYFNIRHPRLLVTTDPRAAYQQGFRAGRASVAWHGGVEPTEPWPRR